MEAGQTLFFVSASKARVGALSLNLVANLLSYLETVGLSAHISKRRIFQQRIAFEALTAIPALAAGFISLELFASIANVVRLEFALGAEALATEEALESESPHVLSSILTYHAAVFVFLVSSR